MPLSHLLKSAAELALLRLLLHQEPHVRGLGYRQYRDEVEIEPADRERFQEWPTCGRTKPYCCRTQTGQPNTLPTGKSSAWANPRCPRFWKACSRRGATGSMRCEKSPTPTP